MSVSSLDEHAEDLFEDAPCGYLATTPDGTLLRVNRTFLAWTGYERQELIGVRRFQDLLSVGGRIYHETHYAPLLRMQGSVREIAFQVVTKGGERLPVLVNSVLVRDADGSPHSVRTVVVDATERKLYELELLAARDRERTARERVERLQRITAVLTEAPDARAVAGCVTGVLRSAVGADRAGFLVGPGGREAPEVLAGDPPPAGLRLDAGYDEGTAHGRVARALLRGAGGAVMWLEWDAPRAIAPEERAFLEACALQAGSALERLRLLQDTREIAISLQRSLLAGALPQDPRFEVATVYHPAVAALEVGGDWYDAFMLPDGGLAVVVGDVVGRGLTAASAMGQLRSAVRALASVLEPAALLDHLDIYVEQVETARYATLAYARLDPATGRLTIASAGHLPAVLVAPSGAAEFVMEGRSAPLGVRVPGRPRRQAGVALAPGGGLVLVTDGLIERRGETIDAALERLLAAVRMSPSTRPADVVAVLLEQCLGGALAEAEDDVCLLSLRLAPGGV